MRRTKVVATIGPASSDARVLGRLLVAGVDVVRLNAAHAKPAELQSTLERVRQAATAVGIDVAVLVDLPGPKIRVGEMSPGTTLVEEQPFELLEHSCVGDSTQACLSAVALSDDVSAGDHILLDDGRIELEVTGAEPGRVSTRVLVGGELTGHKGVNVPGVTLSVDAITAYDREVLAWAQESDVDWIGQSFVRSGDDVAQLKALMTTRQLPVVAKIEKHEAADQLDSIIEAADAVMVARGDLAVETSPERVPVLTRRIVAAAREQGIPVVIATEMLDSMRTRLRPTRAEASDVASAIFMGVDAVMLSGETAVGAHPIEAVETMVRIIAQAESERAIIHTPEAHCKLDTVTQAVSIAACDLATDLEAAAIVPLTQSGVTALAVARYRPESPIVAASPFASTARQLALAWGVRCVVMPFADDVADLLESVVERICEAGHAAPGDRIVLTAGLFVRRVGGTDFVHVRTI